MFVQGLLFLFADWDYLDWRLTAQVKTKEIGIRKVLGACVSGIATLISKDFLKLVIIAIVIATPVAGFAMNK